MDDRMKEILDLVKISAKEHKAATIYVLSVTKDVPMGKKLMTKTENLAALAEKIEKLGYEPTKQELSSIVVIKPKDVLGYSEDERIQRL